MKKKHGAGQFIIKDSGNRQDFASGSVRDTQKGKPRPALIPGTSMVKLAMHYGNGADKYGPSNWRKGQPIMRTLESVERHILAFKCGRIDEEHLIAGIWNLIDIDWTLDMIKHGKLPKKLDDRPYEMQPNNPIGEELYKAIEENVKVANEK